MTPDVLAAGTFFTAAGFAAGRWKVVLLPALLGVVFLLFSVLFGETDVPGERAFQIALALFFVPVLTFGAITCTATGVLVRRYLIPALARLRD